VKLGKSRQEAGKSLLPISRSKKGNPATQLPFLIPTHSFNSWLVPMAGGPNSQAALQLLPALLTIGDAPSVRLCQIFQPSAATTDPTVLEQASRYLLRRRNFSSPLTTTQLKQVLFVKV
jgi:CIC family chloride channel protein